MLFAWLIFSGNGLIYVRDASISMFSSIKVISEITPIPFLKTFLMKYVDENAIFRRQSQTEVTDNIYIGKPDRLLS